MKHHKQKVRRHVVVARAPRIPVTTTTTRSTTSTTSTTVARRIATTNVRRVGVGPRARARRTTGTLAAQPASAHHSGGLSVLTVILIILGLTPLLLLGIGLIGSDYGSRARSRRPAKSVGIPTDR